MSELFADYAAAARKTPAFDEMFDVGQSPRAEYGQVAAALAALNLADVTARADSMARTFLDRGVTFDFAGEERPFPLDIVPRVIAGEDWDVLERGVAQRVRALEAFLGDVYDKMAVVSDGVIPRRLITSSAHFHREVAGFSPAGGVRVHISGIDVVRDQQGTFRVLEDNVRVPSGVSYVLDRARVVAAVRAGVSVAGANLPRARMRDAMADVSLDAQLPAAVLRTQQDAVRDGHCGLLPEARIVPMTRVQIARDRAMAQAVVKARRPGRTVLLVTGAAHADRQQGVPQHLPVDVTVRSLRLLAASEANGDVLSTTRYDATWRTPPRPEKDFCAELRPSR